MFTFGKSEFGDETPRAEQEGNNPLILRRQQILDRAFREIEASPLVVDSLSPSTDPVRESGEIDLAKLLISNSTRFMRG